MCAWLAVSGSDSTARFRRSGARPVHPAYGEKKPNPSVTVRSEATPSVAGSGAIRDASSLRSKNVVPNLPVVFR
jgi:hypothetical protein